MKKNLALLICLLFTYAYSNAQTYGVPCADLFFSEYAEPGVGFGGSKVLEIYNPTPVAINMAGYMVGIVSNGNCNGGSTFALPPINIAPGDVYVINNGNAVGASDPFIVSVRDTIWANLNFNGNDALYLINPNLDTLDIFGTMCLAPSFYWPINTTDSSQNITLIRNPNIHNGEKNWNIAMYQWTGLPVNTFSNLGSHTMIPCGFPIPPVLLFDSTSLTFNEAAGTVIIPFRMTNANNVPTTVDISLFGAGSATAGADFLYATQTITIPAYVNGLIFSDTLHIVDDLLVEPNEDLYLQLTNATNVLLPPQLLINSSLHLFINDNDLPATNNYNFLSPTVVNTNENVTTYSIPVIVNAAATGSYSVDVQYLPLQSSTTLGSDLVYTTQTLTFNSNLDTQYVSVSILDDCECEGLENATFQLINPAGGLTIGTDSIFTLAINPNDSVPAILFGTPTFGTFEGALAQLIPYTLASAYCDTIFVSITVNPASNYLPSPLTWDFYNQPSGTMSIIDTILPGQTSSNVVIDAFTNATLNTSGIPQSFDLTISYADCFANGGMAGGPASPGSIINVVIADSNLPDVVSFTTASASQLESVTAVPILVSNTNAYGQGGVVNISIVGGSATLGTDYTLPVTTLFFGPTDFLLADTIYINNDLVFETTETINLQLSTSSPSLTIGNGAFTDSIIDDDMPLNLDSVYFGIPINANYPENNANYQVTIINSGFGPGPFTVDVAVDNANSTALNGVDFTFTNQTITFNSANDTQSVTFTIIDDCIKEFPESVILKLSNPSIATLGVDSINTIVIAQNDFGSTAFFTAPTIYNVPESIGLDSVAVHLSSAFCAPVTVYYSTTGTASNGVDYTGIATNDSVVFNPGETVKYIIASVVDDLIIESTETIIYTLDSISRGFIGAVTTSTVNIIDNDFPAPSVDFINTSSSHIESAGLIQIPVQVVNMSATTIFVTATLVSGTANIATDLSASAVQTISFPGGSSATQNVIFTIIDDALIEGNEQFTIVLSNPVGGAVIGANSTFTVSIVDNDFAGLTPSIQFQSSAITSNEGNAVVNVPVTATNVNANPITVNFAVNAGSCIAGLDYVVITSSPLSLPSFNILGNIQINVIDDALVEGAENFSVTLSSPTNANLGSLTTSIVTVIDNDYINGISNVSSTSIEVFPNPTASSNALIFKGLQSGVHYNFEVINRVGAKIMQEEILNDRVDLAPFNMANGVYFYRISNANGIQKSGKLVIE